MVKYEKGVLPHTRAHAHAHRYNYTKLTCDSTPYDGANLTTDFSFSCLAWRAPFLGAQESSPSLLA